jgi:hypothetical protein
MKHSHWFLIVLAGLFQPAASFAQITTIPVRAGEHPEYTRLAITFPPDVVWRVTQNARIVDIHISGPEILFDLSQTFARIPRTRLLTAENSTSGLSLTLACDCNVRAAEDLPQMLVLDILSATDIPPAETSAVVRPKLRPERIATSTSSQKAGQNLARELKERDTNTRATSDFAYLPAAPILADVSLPPKSPDNDPIAADFHASDFVQHTLMTLGTGLATAVGIGLLTPAEGTKLTSNDDLSDLPAIPELGRQIQITDAVTRARSDRMSATQTHPTTCPPQDDLAIHLWGPKNGIETSWPNIAAIFDEASRINPNEVRNVAKHLLFLGFGTEAAALLSMLPKEAPEVPLLHALATILDNLPRSDATLTSGLENCGDMGALWTALFYLGRELRQDFPLAQAVRGMANLPHHLRVHLGQPLLHYLISNQQTQHALTLQDIIRRATKSGDVSNPEHALAGNINEPQKPKNKGRVDLYPTYTPTPENVLHELRQNAILGETPSIIIQESAELYIFTLRGTDIAKEIGAEIIISDARRGDFSKAFEKIDGPDLLFSYEDKKIIRNELLDMLLNQEDDGYFIRHMFSANPWGNPVDAPVMLALADRLDMVGFREHAHSLRVVLSDYPGKIENEDFKFETVEADPYTGQYATMEFNQVSKSNLLPTQVRTGSPEDNVTSDLLDVPDTIENNETLDIDLDNIALPKPSLTDNQEKLKITRDNDPVFPNIPTSKIDNYNIVNPSREEVEILSIPDSQAQNSENLSEEYIGPLSLGRRTLADSAALRERLSAIFTP